MASLLVRNIDDSLVRKLKRRAAAHEISAEEEHRRILKECLSRQSARRQTLIEYLVESEVAPQVDLDLARSKAAESREIGV